MEKLSSGQYSAHRRSHSTEPLFITFVQQPDSNRGFVNRRSTTDRSVKILTERDVNLLRTFLGYGGYSSTNIQSGGSSWGHWESDLTKILFTGKSEPCVRLSTAIRDAGGVKKTRLCFKVTPSGPRHCTGSCRGTAAGRGTTAAGGSGHRIYGTRERRSSVRERKSSVLDVKRSRVSRDECHRSAGGPSAATFRRLSRESKLSDH